MKNLRDRVAVVTGAGSGIGLGLAERFAAEGMKLVLADLDLAAIEALAARIASQGGTAIAVKTDVSRLAEVEALARRTMERFGAVHVVCNNAGVGGAAGPAWMRTEKDWEWVLGANLWSVIHGVRVFVPLLLQQDEGHVVNTASMAGLITGAGMSAYNVTKQGVVALSETLALDLQMVGANVKVSVLCPAWVNTKIVDSERSRPEHLRNASDPAIPARPEMEQFIRGVIAAGMPTSQVAEEVVQAIREERFYILTHRDWKPLIAARMQGILDERTPSFTGLPGGTSSTGGR